MTRGVEGGGRRLFEGGDHFKYFYQRGLIIRGRQSESRDSCYSRKYGIFNYDDDDDDGDDDDDDDD